MYTKGKASAVTILTLGLSLARTPRFRLPFFHLPTSLLVGAFYLLILDTHALLVRAAVFLLVASLLILKHLIVKKVLMKRASAIHVFLLIRCGIIYSIRGARPRVRAMVGLSLQHPVIGLNRPLGVRKGVNEEVV